MTLDILRHTSFWVWALLAKLAALGRWHTQARQIGRLRLALLPLVMIGLSVGGVLSSFGGRAVAPGGCGASVGGALAFGRDARNAVVARGATGAPRTGRLHLPGGWLPPGLMPALFAVRYVAGASLGLHPALATDAVFAAACSFGFGGFSGLLLARSLSLHTLAYHTWCAVRAADSCRSAEPESTP